MRAYIDESGDPGTRGSGSRWLALGCVMLADGAAPAVEAAVRRARGMVAEGGRKPERPLHFRELNHDDKVGVFNLLAAEPWVGVIAASDKSKIHPDSGLVNPRLLYNYTARLLIERVAGYARRIQEPATIYFEGSKVFDMADFAEYMNLLADQRRPKIARPFIEPSLIQTLRKGEAPGLELADGIAYAAFRALHPHRKWGHLEPAYLNILLPKLLRSASSGRLLGQGLILMPTGNVSSLKNEYTWIP